MLFKRNGAHDAPSALDFDFGLLGKPQGCIASDLPAAASMTSDFVTVLDHSESRCHAGHA
jgi:hypothetical protein